MILLYPSPMTRPPAQGDSPPGSGPFVWPPRQPGDAPLAPAPPPHSSAPLFSRAIARTRALALDLESALLPRTAEPLRARLATGAIRFDAPDAYCDRCGRDVGPLETEDVGCSACAASDLPWARFIRLGVYGAGLGDAVREVKFHRFRSLGVALGKHLGEALAQAGATRHQPVLVPIPTTTRRRLALGLDHTLTLARGASQTLNAPVIRALARTPGPTQLDVAPSDRASNVARIFRPRQAARKLSERTAILVDDVCTTGATLRSASRALTRGGFARPDRLWAAVVSMAPHP